jgi:hypothetical protein
MLSHGALAWITFLLNQVQILNHRIDIPELTSWFAQAKHEDRSMPNSTGCAWKISRLSTIERKYESMLM